MIRSEDPTKLNGDRGGEETRARRKRRFSVEAPTRRSSNACFRCKSKKIKCHHGIGSQPNICVACAKSNSDCVFDIAPDGVPRGAEYVATLEARIQSLEGELRAVNQGLGFAEGRFPDGSTDTGISEKSLEDCSGSSNISRHDLPIVFNTSVEGQLSTASSSKQPPNPPLAPLSESGSLPSLPSHHMANLLLETAFLYTQARYCIANWVDVREWHVQRESICYASRDDKDEKQIAAYFTWITYAIGAQFVSNSEYPPAAYFARASQFLPVVLASQNLVAVQALLCLIQYNFRATGGPSLWHLAGVTMRMCIELGYHLKSTKPSLHETIDPFTLELQKRSFWCAYCFDRLVSLLSKRPFCIHDIDIDAFTPVNVNATCIDKELIRNLQAKQAAGEVESDAYEMTTMSSSLHHLQIYRLRSRIIVRFSGPHSLPPTHENIVEFLTELDEWRRQAPVRKSLTVLPQQGDDRIQSIYYQAALLLIRPVLGSTTVEADLLATCATLSAEACENAKILSLSPQTHNSRITVYNCFRCGITFLQCLAIRPTVLPLRQTLRAISSCSSALAVYTRTLAAAAPFLQLFEKLSDRFLGDENEAVIRCPDDDLKATLQRMTLSDPTETLEVLRSLADKESQRKQQDTALDTFADPEPNLQYDFLRSSDPMVSTGMDLLMPFDMYSELPQDTSHQGMMNFWSGSY